MELKELILKKARANFKQHGLDGITAESMIQQLDVSQEAFEGIFTNPEDLVSQVVSFDATLREARHKELLADSQNAVEDLMLLVQDGIRELTDTSPVFYAQLQEHYPAAWEKLQSHLDSYSYPLIAGILNKGVLEGNFRRDINIQLVTKIIMEQVLMLLNPAVFPPERYNLAEVFRSIFLYYMRGLCTDTGSRLAEAFFSRNSL